MLNVDFLVIYGLLITPFLFNVLAALALHLMLPLLGQLTSYAEITDTDCSFCCFVLSFESIGNGPDRVPTAEHRNAERIERPDCRTGLESAGFGSSMVWLKVTVKAFRSAAVSTRSAFRRSELRHYGPYPYPN